MAWLVDRRRTERPTGAPQTDRREVAALALGTPPGIVLSPQSPTLLGQATADLPITAAYAVASLDPVLRPAPATPNLHGTVEGLAIAPAAEADMRLLKVADARAGRGLDGDRYAARAGTFSPRADRRPGYDLTLIAAEASMNSPQPATPSTSSRPDATSSPAASTSTPWSAAPSASATCSVQAVGCASPASTWTDSAGPACCGHSSTRAACVPTSSPTERSDSERPSDRHGPPRGVAPPPVRVGARWRRLSLAAGHA